VAAKTRASLMVEGELPEEGLAALEGDGGHVYLALARRLVAVEEDAASRAPSLEALFADARRSEDAADRLLAEGDWEDEDELPAAPIPFPVRQAAMAGRPLNALPLFATDAAASLVSAPPNGRVVTLAELAQFVRRRKARRKRAPEGQLALFGT
jgi:hypothetical protein